MLFNSFVFLGFFLVVYLLYLSFQSNRKIQNVLLLVASYVFYGTWDYRFLGLLLLSTVIDFFVGRKMHASQNQGQRKALLGVSLFSNLAILGFFKYAGFFSESLVALLNTIGFKPDHLTMHIILPVGISFYTFQTLSYTFDIYRRQLKPAKSFLDFALFVSFFPQLVAGPIERARTLLPQICHSRKLSMDQINAGLFLVLWGYFKKVVIADNVAVLANQVFNNYTDYEGLALLVGVLAFTVQIYCDFSGYSDIARGISKLMGFDLMVNFKLPYFSLNPSDFWSRWHVSLSSWLRDYLYIALGGNRSRNWLIYRNLMLTMLLGGLWHGAAWNFVIWGLFHGVILVLYRLFDKNPEHANPWNGQYHPVRILSKMALMFAFTLVGWVIFRADSSGQIWYFLSHPGWSMTAQSWSMASSLFVYSLPLVAVQLYQYVSRDLLVLTKLPLVPRLALYSFFLVIIAAFSSQESVDFIYFQF